MYNEEITKFSAETFIINVMCANYQYEIDPGAVHKINKNFVFYYEENH